MTDKSEHLYLLLYVLLTYFGLLVTENFFDLIMGKQIKIVEKEYISIQETNFLYDNTGASLTS